MKRALIMTCIAILAITSCSKDVVKEVNRGHAIDFRAATQTKGKTIYGTWTLGSFYATAFEGESRYFSDVVFSQVGEYFSSNTVYYWPAEETSLDFVTYSPSLSDLGGEDAAVLERSETQSYKITNITPKDDVYEQFDFVTALATGQTEAGTENGIPLNFYHNMTGISFTARENLGDYEYKVAGVRIDNAVPSGDYDLTSGKWTLGTGRKSYEKIFVDPITQTINPITLGNDSQSLYGTYTDKNGHNQEHYAFIIPQPFDDGTEAGTTALPTFSVYLQVNFIQGEGENQTKTKVFPTGGDYGWVKGYFPGISGETTLVYEWEKGVKYNYEISFTDPSTVLGDAVKMTVEFKEWVDAGSNTIANKNMIGVWNAVSYYQEVITSKTTYDEEKQKDVPVKDEDGNYVLETGEIKDGNYVLKTEIIDETTESSEIASEVGGFNYVVIDDGTALRIKGANDQLFSTPYVLENDYLLIENFEKDGEYEVRPHIDEITPVGENNTNGSGVISVLQVESGTKEEGNYRRRTQYITYEILPITSLNE